MSSSILFKALFFCVVVLLVKQSTQQEVFEDAVKLENEFGESFVSPAEEYSVPDEGTSLTENESFDSIGGTPSLPEDEKENNQPQFYEPPEYHNVDHGTDSVETKHIDKESQSNMEEDPSNNDKHYDSDVPYPEDMRHFDENPNGGEASSGKMPKKKEFHKSKSKVGNVRHSESLEENTEAESKDTKITDSVSKESANHEMSIKESQSLEENTEAELKDTKMTNNVSKESANHEMSIKDFQKQGKSTVNSQVFEKPNNKNKDETFENQENNMGKLSIMRSTKLRRNSDKDHKANKKETKYDHFEEQEQNMEAIPQQKSAKISTDIHTNNYKSKDSSDKNVENIEGQQPIVEEVLPKEPEKKLKSADEKFEEHESTEETEENAQDSPENIEGSGTHNISFEEIIKNESAEKAKESSDKKINNIENNDHNDLQEDKNKSSEEHERTEETEKNAQDSSGIVENSELHNKTFEEIIKNESSEKANESSDKDTNEIVNEENAENMNKKMTKNDKNVENMEKQQPNTKEVLPKEPKKNLVKSSDEKVHQNMEDIEQQPNIETPIDSSDNNVENMEKQQTHTEEVLPKEPKKKLVKSSDEKINQNMEDIEQQPNIEASTDSSDKNVENVEGKQPNIEEVLPKEPEEKLTKSSVEKFEEHESTEETEKKAQDSPEKIENSGTHNITFEEIIKNESAVKANESPDKDTSEIVNEENVENMNTKMTKNDKNVENMEKQQPNTEEVLPKEPKKKLVKSSDEKVHQNMEDIEQPNIETSTDSSDKNEENMEKQQTNTEEVLPKEPDKKLTKNSVEEFEEHERTEETEKNAQDSSEIVENSELHNKTFEEIIKNQSARKGKESSDKDTSEIVNEENVENMNKKMTKNDKSLENMEKQEPNTEEVLSKEPKKKLVKVSDEKIHQNMEDIEQQPNIETPIDSSDKNEQNVEKQQPNIEKLLPKEPNKKLAKSSDKKAHQNMEDIEQHPNIEASTDSSDKNVENMEQQTNTEEVLPKEPKKKLVKSSDEKIHQNMEDIEQQPSTEASTESTEETKKNVQNSSEINKISELHNKTFEEMIKEEAAEKAIQSLDKDKYEENAENMENEGQSSNHVLSTLENVYVPTPTPTPIPIPTKKRVDILKTLENAQLPKKSNRRGDNNSFVGGIFENNQNLKNIRLEWTNRTSSDDIFGSKSKPLPIQAYAAVENPHGDDLSGVNNNTLPSAYTTEKLNKMIEVNRREVVSGDGVDTKPMEQEGESNTVADRKMEDEGNSLNEENIASKPMEEKGGGSDSSPVIVKPTDDDVESGSTENAAAYNHMEDKGGESESRDAVADKEMEEHGGESANGEFIGATRKTTRNAADDEDNVGTSKETKDNSNESHGGESGGGTTPDVKILMENNQLGLFENKNENNSNITLEEGYGAYDGDDVVETSKSGLGSTDDGEEEMSGAERERRQAFTTEEQINEAKSKLNNAKDASDALTNIEKEMGLEPSIAPAKTKNLTSALHSEIDKFKNMISQQDDATKKSKFQKLEKLAEEDVKGANDVMKLIVELEVAKFFAKHRARKKLELAIRNKITTPPSPPAPQASEWNTYQGMAPNYMQPYQDQVYSSPNPYAGFTNPPQSPLSYTPQLPRQPAPVANPLEGQFSDSNVPPSWSPQVSPFVAPQSPPQDYSPYIGTPMNAAPANLFQVNNQPLQAYAPNPPVNTVQYYAPKPDAPALPPPPPSSSLPPPPLPPPPKVEAKLQHDNPPPRHEAILPKSSPFAGLRPLQSSSFESVQPQQQAPTYSSEMKSQAAPLSSLKQSSFAATSVHPFSDALSSPPMQPKFQTFYPHTSWVPPPQVNTFSDSLSHLNLNYQKPAAAFKPQTPKPAPRVIKVKPYRPNLKKMMSQIVRSRSRPLMTQPFHPEPAVAPPMQQQFYDYNPSHAPPMYPQFDVPAPLEPAVQVQPQAAQYFQQPRLPYQQPQVPYMGLSPPVPAPLPVQQTPPQPFKDEKKNEDNTDINPMNLQFNDEQPQGLQYQGPAMYPQQQQIQQAYNGYNSWSNPVTPYSAESFYQPPFSEGYGYQPPSSYEEQLVNPLLNEAIAKIHDTKKAAQVVQKIEDTIGLSPPAINHIIDDVESETKNEKLQYDQAIQHEQEKIKNDKKLMDDVPVNDGLKKKLEDEKKELEEDKKRENIAKTKLATIKKIEKILTIIETAKYSALKRAKEHLMRLKSEKDPQIRKRSLEALERDLHQSERRHLHRRHEINIWLKGSKNNINTSHFIEDESNKKNKNMDNKDNKDNSLHAFGSPSIPKLQIAKFAAKFAKKANITLPKMTSKRNEIKKPKKSKIGVILMKKLLQRMDDLYDMQSKILTQLIKDHQKIQKQNEKESTRSSLYKRHRNVIKRRTRRHSHHSNR